MQKIILVTGSTDGIGLATAKMLVSLGHHVLLHGRNPPKLEEAKKSLREGDTISVRTFLPIEKLRCLSETDNRSLTLEEIEVSIWGDGVVTCRDTTPKEFTLGTDENNKRAMDAIRAMSQGHNCTDKDLNGPGSDSTPS